MPDIRRGLVRLLGVIASTFHGYGNFALGDLSVAVSSANFGDRDFFANITHVQLHRRVKALRQVRLLLAAKHAPLSTATLVHFVLPLITSAIVEASKQKENQIRSEAIATVGAIARLLPWSHYSALLLRFLREVRRFVVEHVHGRHCV